MPLEKIIKGMVDSMKDCSGEQIDKGMVLRIKGDVKI
jgi:hypothetical protein